MKQLLKSKILKLGKYWVPRGLYNERKRRKQKRLEANPKCWFGSPIPRNASAFPFSPGQDLEYFTIIRETDSRFCCQMRSGQRIKIESPAESSVVLGITSADARAISNLKIREGNRVLAELTGKLSENQWTNIKLKDLPQQAELEIDYSGRSDAYVSFSTPYTKKVKQTEADEQKNVIVMILDGIDLNLLGLYDSQSTLTPNIDRFFGESLVFNNAFSTAEWTLPSVSAMFTGTYPNQHGVFNKLRAQRGIPSQVPTLAEGLQKAGYTTLCYSTAKRLSPRYRFDRGFDRFLYKPDIEFDDPKETLGVVANTIDFIEANSDQPFFCFLHCFESHPPFGKFSYLTDTISPTKRWASTKSAFQTAAAKKIHPVSFEGLVQMGRAKLREMDLSLSLLFNYLKSSGLDKNTAVLLLADHGALDTQSSPLLVRRNVHIPLLIREPSRTSDGLKRIDEFAEPGIDLMPTVLGLANTEIPDSVTGQDLMNSDLSKRKFAASQSLYDGAYELALRSADWSYMFQCSMDLVSGKIEHEKPKAEFLFARDHKSGREKLETNFLHSETQLANEFRSQAEAFLTEHKRYYDNRELLTQPDFS